MMRNSGTVQEMESGEKEGERKKSGGIKNKRFNVRALILLWRYDTCARSTSSPNLFFGGRAFVEGAHGF